MADLRLDAEALDASSKLKVFKRKSGSDDQVALTPKKPALDEDLPSTSAAGDACRHEVAEDVQVDSIADPKMTCWIRTFDTWSSCEKLRALSHLVENCSLSDIRHLQRTIEPYFQKDFISLLPKEVALYVLSMLDARDLIRAARTCSYWRTLTEDHLLWREKCTEANYGWKALPPSSRPSSRCFARSPWKALYLRHSLVDSNWRRATHPLSDCRLLRGHDEHVITCLLICGDRVVSGSDDTTLRIWCLTSGECEMALVGHTGGVWSSQISDDGQTVISGSTDRSVRVWQAATGKCIHQLNGHTSTVRCMALCGNTLVSGSRDTTLRVWNIDSGEQLFMLSGHVASIRCVQFDGRRIVSGAYDYTIKVWDTQTRLCVHTLTGHTNRVYSLLFDSARDLVVSGSLDTSIRVWDVATGQCRHALMGHQSLTSGMQLRGRTLVSGNADSTVKVWDVVSGHCVHTLSGVNKHQSAVTSLQLLDSGLVVTSSDDGTVKLWDAKQGSFVRNLVQLDSGGGSGGCIWRLKATASSLVCAVGSRNGTEDTKLIVLDFNADYP